MPTALTVAADCSEIVPPLATYCAVPDPGTGVEPSVVYQMPVLPRGNDPEVNPGSFKVTVNGYDCAPEAGEMVGAALGKVCTVDPVTFPVRAVGVVTVPQGKVPSLTIYPPKFPCTVLLLMLETFPQPHAIPGALLEQAVACISSLL